MRQDELRSALLLQTRRMRACNYLHRSNCVELNSRTPNPTVRSQRSPRLSRFPMEGIRCHPESGYCTPHIPILHNPLNPV